MATKLRGVKVVTYHNSFPNFAKAFGIDVISHVEPKPGIPPSPAHVKALEEQMKAQQVPLIFVEPYFDDKLPAKIAQETGAKLLIFLPSVGGEPHVKRYTDLFDYDLKLATDALASAGGRP